VKGVSLRAADAFLSRWHPFSRSRHLAGSAHPETPLDSPSRTELRLRTYSNNCDSSTLRQEVSLQQCNCVVRTGDAWEELIRLGGNRPDSLIVCGTRDLGSLRRVLFGSTGLKLLRLAPGPVWIVKPTPIENDTTDIVACTDLGPVGSDVIQTAVSMAAINSARVHIVHAAEPGADTIELTDRVHAQLAATDYRTLQAGVKVNVPVGDADQCILECVEQCHADLVILGTSSKTGTSGLLPGSTVERLLPELKCSVLALKPEGFHSVLPPEFWTMQRVNEA
jgi:universal stress protein E